MKQGMRKQTIFFIIILFTALSFSGYQFYRLQGNDMRFTNVGPVYDSISKLENLSRNGGLKLVKNLVEQGRVKEASSYLAEISRKIEFVSDVTKANESKKLSKEILNLKSNINNILVQSDPKTIYMVLANKVGNFHNIMFRNKWRTLTRTSRIILEKVKISKVFGRRFFSHNRMRKNLIEIQGLLNKMEKITKGSILSNANQNLILTQIKTFMPELNLLRKYVLSIKGFRFKYNRSQKSYMKWFNSSSSVLNNKKESITDFMNEINFGLLLLVSFLSLAIFIGLVLSKVFSSTDQELIENKIVGIVDSIIANKNKKIALANLSQKTKDQIYKYEKLMYKKINLGNRLKDGIPFPSALFDSNLNLIWGNELFYNCFNLEQGDCIHGDVNWSKIQQSTNLGESDPLLAALGDDIAGIYQIQLENDDKGILPYELYVTPVLDHHNRNIYVTMYPLSEIEDTLDNQLKTLVNPILTSLDAIKNERFDRAYRDNVEHEFNIAGIKNVFTKLTSINENFVQQKHSLLNEVESLENDVYDKIKIINDSMNCSSDILKTKNLLKSSFNNVKNEVIKNIDTRYEEEDLWTELLTESKKVLSYTENIYSNSSRLFNDSFEIRSTILTLSPIKSDLKKLKLKLEEEKGEILRNLEQDAVRNKISGKPISEFSAQIKKSFSIFNKTNDELTLMLTQFDIGISKLDLLSSKIEEINYDETGKITPVEFDNRIEKLNIEFMKNTHLGKESDDEIISSLRNVYDNILNDRNQYCEMVSILNNSNIQDFSDDQNKRADNLDSKNTNVLSDNLLDI